MRRVPGLATILKPQFRLAGSWLSGAARVAAFPMTSSAIELAVRSFDVAAALRPGQDDVVKQLFGQIWKDIEAGTRALLKTECGADWERRGDLSATIEALPLVLGPLHSDYDSLAVSG